MKSSLKFFPIALLYVVLLVTNRWHVIEYPARHHDFSNPTDSYYYNDAPAYLEIAEKAPALPGRNDPRSIWGYNTRFPYHIAQRFVPPYLVGVSAWLTGVSCDLGFTIAVIGICLAILIVVHSIMRELNIPPSAHLLCMAMLIFVPYEMRYSLYLAPQMNDQVFNLGLAVIILGLVRCKPAPVLSGMVVAILARQTAILAVPFVALWMLVGSSWRAVARGRRIMLIVAVTVTAIVGYLGTGVVAATFAAPSHNLDHLVGGFSWYRSSFDVRLFTEFLARGALPFVFPAALLLTAWMAGLGLAVSRWPWEAKCCLVMTGLVCLQPVLAGPAITSGNSHRLNALGLIPLLIAVGLVLKETQAAERVDRAWLAVLIGMVAMGSLHHMFSFIGTTPARAEAFVLVHALLAAVFAVASYAAFRDLQSRRARSGDHAG